MQKFRLIAGTLVFGSLWGLSECLIGPALSDAGLPGGMIMTGTFTMFFLVLSRMIFQQRGMQVGMGLIAGGLRLFNPFGGCHLCSALAIMAEGMIFELIWNYAATKDFKNLKNLSMKLSVGIVTAYSVYVGGYIVTQILTPVFSTGFYVGNLLAFIPQILARGLPVALIGGVTIPLTLSLQSVKVPIKDSIYYPTTIGISCICWILIIGTWLSVVG